MTIKAEDETVDEENLRGTVIRHRHPNERKGKQEKHTGKSLSFKDLGAQ